MASTNNNSITLQPFATADKVFTTINKAIDHLCWIPVLAIPPRIVQIALNTLGVVGGSLSSALSGLFSLAPLPASLKGKVIHVRDESWNFTCKRANNIGNQIIAAIPITGPKVLSQLSNEIDTNRHLSGEIEGLKATGRANDAEIARNLEEIRQLKEKIKGFAPAQEQAQILAAAVHELEEKNAALLSQVREALQTFDGQVQQLTAKLATEGAELSSKTKALEQQKQILEQQNTAAEALRQEIAAAIKEKAEIQGRLVATEQEVNRAKESHEKIVLAAQAEKDDFEAKVRDQQGHIDELTQELKTHTSASEQSSQEVHRLQSLLDAAEQTLTEIREELQAAQKRNDQHDEELDTARGTITGLQDTNGDLQQQILDLTADNQRLQAIIGRLHNLRSPPSPKKH